MSKDLFGDLTSDVSEKYKNKNDQATREEIVKYIDEIIGNFEKASRDHLWAEVVIDTFNDECKKHADEIESYPNYSRFSTLNKEAKDFLVKEGKEVEKSNTLEAQIIDEKIKYLLSATKNRAWCDECDDLFSRIEDLSDEARTKCKKLVHVDRLMQIRKQVPRIIDIDFEILKLKYEKVDTAEWYNRVVNYKSVIDAELYSLLTNKGMLEGFVREAKIRLKEMEKEAIQERKEEAIRQKKEREEARERRLLEAELEYKSKEKERIRQQELQEREKQAREQALLDMFKSLNPDFAKDYELGIVEEKIAILGVKNDTIKNVKIVDGVQVIGTEAFANNAVITSVEFSDTVEQICGRAFENCENLKSVKFGKGLSTFARNGFAGCNKLSKISISKDNESFFAKGGCVYGDKEKHSLELYAPGKRNKKFKVPNSVKFFRAEMSNIYIKKVDLGNVVQISSSAFLNCKNLRTIKVGDNLKHVFASAFEGCENLTNIITGARKIETNSVADILLNCKNLNEKSKKCFISVRRVKGLWT